MGLREAGKFEGGFMNTEQEAREAKDKLNARRRLVRRVFREAGRTDGTWVSGKDWSNATILEKTGIVMPN